MSRAATEPFAAFFAKSEGWTVRPYLWHLKPGCSIGAATGRLTIICWFWTLSGRGGTGRRAGFKIQFREECRFDSDRPHHLLVELSDVRGHLSGMGSITQHLNSLPS